MSEKDVYIVMNHLKCFKSSAMNVKPLFVPIAIGVMNIKQIMKFESAIDVMPFIAGIVMKWINAMIVERSFVPPVQPCSVVNSVGVACAKNVPQRAVGTFFLVGGRIAGGTASLHPASVNP
jgi:hypothetical protein